MEIAIVILNWNGLGMMQRYLPGVVASASGFTGGGSDSAFVVVADNGSTDGSLEWLAKEWSGVKVLPLDRNYGFTGGYNRALEQIEADYYILLNSDVDTPAGWLEPLAAFMEGHPDAGICQPKILADADRSRFEYAGACGGFIDRYGYPFCRGRILSSTETDRGQYDEPIEIFWATGACLMIRSSLYHHLGGLDESFFAHMEEVDLCWRAKRLGYEIWCVPQSKVYHLGGGTLPQNSPRKLYLNYRNNLLMLRKNLPESIRPARMMMRFTLDRASAMVYLLTGQWSNFKAVLRAHRDYRRMKKDIEVNDAENGPLTGYYPRSIVLRYYLSRGRITFDKLDF